MSLFLSLWGSVWLWYIHSKSHLLMDIWAGLYSEQIWTGCVCVCVSRVCKAGVPQVNKYENVHVMGMWLGNTHVDAGWQTILNKAICHQKVHGARCGVDVYIYLSEQVWRKSWDRGLGLRSTNMGGGFGCTVEQVWTAECHISSKGTSPGLELRYSNKHTWTGSWDRG